MSSPVRDFWDDQARRHGTSDLATAPDHYYRALEINQIKSKLIDGEHVLDAGCGNGFSTLLFSKACPHSTFVGIDYSKQMILQANAALAKTTNRRVSFAVNDVLDLPDLGEFDTIISERCIINLHNFGEQKAAILQMAKALKPNGRIILVENTQEGLQSLNLLRTKFDLPEIKTRWHNYYIPQRELEQWLPLHFEIESVENIGNLYYLMSRVLYAKLAQIESKEPQYDHLINLIASQLPSLGKHYAYSPNFMYVLRLRSAIHPSVSGGPIAKSLSP